MEILIWGTRGSIPCPGPDTVRYGGNTTCVEVRHGDDFIIVDAGTGIRKCGETLIAERGQVNEITLLMTHTHWDHIQGFPFFVPVFIPGNQLSLMGPHLHTKSFGRVMEDQMQYSYFPVNFAQLQGQVHYDTLRDGQTFNVGSITVKAKYVNHPVPTLSYRFQVGDRSIVFMTDVEPYRDVLFDGECPSEAEREEFEDVQQAVAEQNQALVDFASGANVLIHDAQYTRDEYLDGKIGWGHTSMEDAIELGRRAKVRDLLLCHHDPNRTDDELDRLVGGHQEGLGREKGCPLQKLEGLVEGRRYLA